ncbi:MAG: hypothetical protein ABSG73_14540 [Candidatus Aminicenantales bacterium]
MNEKKDLFAVEDDYFYLILRYVIYDKRERIRSLSPQDLYKLMVDNAEEMKLKDFQKYYKSPMSMAKHLANIKGELAREFTMDIFTRADHQREYSLGPTEDQDHDFLISAEQLMDALGMDPSQAKDLPCLLNETVEKAGLEAWGLQENGKDYWLDIWPREGRKS